MTSPLRRKATARQIAELHRRYMLARMAVLKIIDPCPGGVANKYGHEVTHCLNSSASDAAVRMANTLLRLAIGLEGDFARVTGDRYAPLTTDLAPDAWNHWLDEFEKRGEASHA